MHSARHLVVFCTPPNLLIRQPKLKFYLKILFPNLKRKMPWIG